MYTGRLRAQVNPLTLLNTMFDRNGPPFIQLLLTNGPLVIPSLEIGFCIPSTAARSHYQRPLDSRTRTTTRTRLHSKFFHVLSKYRHPGIHHCTVLHEKSQHCYHQTRTFPQPFFSHKMHLLTSQAFLQTVMRDFSTLSYTSTIEIPTLSYT